MWYSVVDPDLKSDFMEDLYDNADFFYAYNPDAP